MSVLGTKTYALALGLIAIIAAPISWAATPCDGIDRKITPQRQTAIAPHIAKQLQVKKADVLKSFQYRGWSIFYVETHETDEAYVFYSGDPLKSAYVTLWGGAARKDEEREIRQWTLKNAPGIPNRLAGCFAWHVTNEP